ncbi:MAG TPA: OmpH family outer membrane protein [Acidobacteriota bacterium]|nr:OmpH family outer membrane protein [Acidobacteriota bacterium]
MNRLFWGIFFAIFFMPALVTAQAAEQAAGAQATGGIAPARLAWMDLERAIYTCDEGTRMLAEIQQFIEGKNLELDGLRKEVDNLRNQLIVQGARLTDEARLDLEEEAAIKETTLERFQQDTQREINSRRTRLESHIGSRMLPIIEKISKEKNLSAILFFNSARDAWVDPSLNVTEEIIKYYNQAYPVAAPKPAAR